MAEPFRLIRVVKIGGSLLGLADLRDRIKVWQLQQTPAATVWLVGGGELVDEIRQLSKQNELDAEEAHWSSIAAMNENSKRIANIFPEWLCDDRIDPDALSENTILMPLNWARCYGSHLPATWDVTSDSIAATLAHWIGSHELVLLKSADPPANSGLNAAVAYGYVDGYFATALASRQSNTRSASLRVRAVNLRSTTFSETLLKF